MNENFVDFLNYLNKNNVEYLVVGAYAVSIYTEPRATKDFDIWIKASQDNSENVYKSLIEFGAPVDAHEITSDTFSQTDTGYRFGNPPLMIDILTVIDGVEFDQAWEQKVMANYQGTEINFVSYDDLVTNKKASGRPQDLADLDKLVKARDAQDD